jgi:hypothetical protein
MPRLLADSVKVTFVNLLYCGILRVPVTALVGLLLAATGRLMMSTVERARAEPDAD